MYERIVEYTIISVPTLQFLKAKNHYIDYSLPNAYCSNNLCLVSIQAVQGYQVNLTVTKILGAGR